MLLIISIGIENCKNMKSQSLLIYSFPCLLIELQRLKKRQGGVELALNSLPPGRKPLIKSEMAKRWAMLQGNLEASPLKHLSLDDHPIQSKNYSRWSPRECTPLGSSVVEIFWISGSLNRDALQRCKRTPGWKISLLLYFFPQPLEFYQQHTTLVLKIFICC